MLSKVNRLKDNANFELVFKKGEKYYSPYFVAYSFNSELNQPYKVGLIASKKVGNAVNRNKAKRLLSQAIRNNDQALKGGFYYVFIALNTTPSATLEQLETEFKKGFKA